MKKLVEYVDKSAVLDAIENVKVTVHGDATACDAVRFIMDMLAPEIRAAVEAVPLADVEPVIRAHWDEITGTEEDPVKSEMVTVWKCSNCGALLGHPKLGNPNDTENCCHKCRAHMGKVTENGKAD